GSAGNEEPLEQRTCVPVERLAELSRRHRLVEGDHVTPDPRHIEPALFVPTRDDHVGPQPVADHVERLAQCRPGVLLVELRPEQREQTIAAVETPGGGGGEVGEQRQAPRSGEEAFDLAPLGIGEVQSPEQPALDHTRPLRTCAEEPAAPPRLGTRRSRSGDALSADWLRPHARYRSLRRNAINTRRW